MVPARVTSISAELERPSTFVLETSGHAATFFSSSVLIERVLLSAFLTDAQVEVDLVDDSKEIKRVHAFEPGNGRVVKLSGDEKEIESATLGRIE